MPKNNEYDWLQTMEWNALGDYFKLMMDIEARLVENDERALDVESQQKYEREAWKSIHYAVGEMAHLSITFIDTPKVTMPSPLHLDSGTDLRTAIARAKAWCVTAEHAIREAHKPKLSAQAMKIAEHIAEHPGMKGWDIDDALFLELGTTASIVSRFLKHHGFINEANGYYAPGHSYANDWACDTNSPNLDSA